jgi:putative ABC transport system substrate-binding protein
MRRREFMTLMGGLAAAWPTVARAQPPVMPVIGVLGSASARGFAPQLEALRKSLGGAGYVEGRNVAIEYRWADSDYGRLPKLAEELIRRRADVIVAMGPPAAVAAKAATATIPVVFVAGFDPVSAGIVASLSHPGGNLTGFYLFIGGLVAKRLELLREMAPELTRFGVIVNPGNPSAKLDASEIEIANRIGFQAETINAGTDAEIASAYAALSGRKAAAIIGTDTFYFDHRESIVAVAAQRRVPTIYYAREFVTAGGLMSYGANISDVYLQAGVYVARLLKGEKPSEMPVQQPTTFEFVLNVKTAKALGLAVPATLLGRADEVIE